MRILLVEDNADHRELMSLALTGHDPTWQVEGVASGEGALRRLAQEEAYALVFLDYRLPGWNGLEVLEKIRRGEAPPPVVMVTGRGDEQVAVEAMKGGAYDYVVKGEGYLERLPVVARRAVEARQLAVEREQAEEALRASARQWRATFDAIGDAVNVLDLQGRILRCNMAMTHLLGKRFDEIIGQTCWKLMHGTSQPIEGCPLLRMRETRRRETLVMTIADRWLEVSVDPLLDETGNLIGAVHIMADITERKRAEERIKASLEEKEVLLQEIHHRVKNNLQVMSSLLKLQSRDIKDERYAEMLNESQNRVAAMSLIHEKLYQSEDLARIDFGGYIKSLARGLFSAYRAEAGRITLRTEVEDIRLGVNCAMPCGLIINELVSNCLKHAFPKGKKGEIRIAMRRIGDNEVELVVSDNGIGIPESLDFRNPESLGLRLVTMLAQDQLGGQIELDRTEGTRLQIKFSVAV